MVRRRKKTFGVKRPSEKRFRFELRRKGMHIVFGLIFAIIIYFLPENYQTIFFATILGLGLFFSVYERFFNLPFVSDLLDLFERTKHRHSFPGKPLVMMVAGILLMTLFLPKLYVMLGMTIVIFGDTLCSLVGMRWGYIPIPWDRTKALEGRLFGLLVSFLAMVGVWSIFKPAYYFYNILSFSLPALPYGILFLGAAAGILIESLPHDKLGLDDNLLAPFIAALVIYLLV